MHKAGDYGEEAPMKVRITGPRAGSKAAVIVFAGMVVVMGIFCAIGWGVKAGTYFCFSHSDNGGSYWGLDNSLPDKCKYF